MNVSLCRYFRCTKCGRVYEKENLAQKVKLYAGEAEVISSGNVVCSHCGTKHPNAELYAGKYDLPASEWCEFERQTGLKVEFKPGD